MDYFLGIDGRMQKVTAVLFDQDGNEVAAHSRTDFMHKTDGICECDMIEFWHAAADAVKQVMRQTRIQPESVMGISVTGESEGLWAIDAKGNPVFSAINFEDQRAHEAAYSINDKTPGIGKLVHRTLGRKITAGSPLALLKWLKQTDLTAYNRIDKVFFAKDWLRLCMTGVVSTDPSDVHGTLYTFHAPEPPMQLLTVLGLPEIADFSPDVLSPTEWVGTLNIHAAEEMGLYPGIPVAVGTSENTAALLGSGTHSANTVGVILDDVGKMVSLRKRSDCDLGKTGHRFAASAYDDHCVEIIRSFNGYNRIRWATETFLEPSEREQADAIIETVEAGCGGVIYFENLRQNGGSFFGTHYSTTRAEFLRAVYESVAYEIKDAFQTALKTDQIMLAGGNIGRILPQIIADVVGVRVECVEHAHLSARGAALCAAVTTIQFRDLQSAMNHCCGEKTVYEPQSSPVYEQRFMLYKALRKASKSFRMN